MAGKLYNLARMTTATTGTGTITLGAAAAACLTFALAGVANGETVSYGIRDGANSEVGTGVYTSAGTTLTRTVTASTNANAAINLSGTAEVFITPRKEDLISASEANSFTAAEQAQARANIGAVLNVAQTVDTTNRSTTSAAFAASGVISPSITPASASSKIMVTVSGLVGADAGAGVFFTLFRSINGAAYADITPVGVTEMQGFVIGSNALSEALSISFLDSPAATTAVLYQLYWKVNTSTGRLGRRGVDTLFNSPTVITVTEIK